MFNFSSLTLAERERLAWASGDTVTAQTLAALDDERRDACAEAFDEGREEGYEEGFTAGYDEAEAEHAEKA